MAGGRTRLVIIRHGESQAQIDGVVSGHETCNGLTPHGRRQAAALRDRLDATGELADAAAIYSSLLRRAVETAEIIRPAISSNLEVLAQCGWCELHPGAAEGLTWSEMVDRFPPMGDPDDPFRRRVPGMETWAELYLRVGARLTSLADEHPGQCVVIIAHGGTVAASLVARGELPIRHGAVAARDTTNTSITEWMRADDQWDLVRQNDSAHLSTLPRSP
jgi:probable phosphoglycerate mutase